MVRNLTPHWIDHGGERLTLTFSPNGAFLLCASRGSAHGETVNGGPLQIIHTSGKAIIWNTEDWIIQTHLNDDYFHAAAWHPMSHLIATSSRKKVTLWEVSTGQQRQKFLEIDEADDPAEYCGLAFSPNGGCLAVCSEYGFADADVLLLDSETGEVVNKLAKEEDGRTVLQVKFLPDGERVVGLSYAYDYQVDRAYVWRALDGTVPIVLDFEEGGYVYGVWQIEFSPDGQILVTMGVNALKDEGDEKTSFAIRLWDTVSGQQLATCSMSGECFCFGISPKGNLLAMMSADVKSANAPEYVLTLWDIPSGQVKISLKSPNQKPNLLYYRPESLVFSPDGRWLAVGHRTKVEIWNIEQILGS